MIKEFFHRADHPEDPTLRAIIKVEVEPDGAFEIKWVRFDRETEGGRHTGETIKKDTPGALTKEGFDLTDIKMSIEDEMEGLEE